MVILFLVDSDAGASAAHSPCQSGGREVEAHRRDCGLSDQGGVRGKIQGEECLCVGGGIAVHQGGFCLMFSGAGGQGEGQETVKLHLPTNQMKLYMSNHATTLYLFIFNINFMNMIKMPLHK